MHVLADNCMAAPRATIANDRALDDIINNQRGGNFKEWSEKEEEEEEEEE